MAGHPDSTSSSRGFQDLQCSGRTSAMSQAENGGQTRSKRRNRLARLKRKRIEDSQSEDMNVKLKRTKWSSSHTGEAFHSKDMRTASVLDIGKTCISRETRSHDTFKSTLALGDSWERDSGFSSETSPPTSGCNSPWHSVCPTSIVSLDCEMVGTGPGGRCSELARCSVLDYYGNVLYDQYICPRQPVTDYRTRWSGIQKGHLLTAVPFGQARTEILHLLDQKVVVGHSVHNDFLALDMSHPGHLVRDTSTMRSLVQLAGFTRDRRLSLKILADRLLNRKIQAGAEGHSSVEDARAALDLYKLVESEWEQVVRDGSGHGDRPPTASPDHYMQDQYWPEELTQGWL